MKMIPDTTKAAVVPAGWLLLLFLCGCDSGAVGPHAYEIAKALNTACNLKDEARLEAIAGIISTARDRQEITNNEADRLLDIVEQAREGNWESAEQDARRVLSEQIQG